jgi:hypothetical protein
VKIGDRFQKIFLGRRIGQAMERASASADVVHLPPQAISPLIRGRVSRVSVIRGGEVSVVMRFGLEEKHQALTFQVGELVGIARSSSAVVQPGQLMTLGPDDKPVHDQVIDG